MSILFSPFRLRQRELVNRIVFSPMCRYFAEAGQATTWRTVHLGGLVRSGAGMLCLEATGIATIAVGLITEPQQGRDIRAHGRADLVALARASSTTRAGAGTPRPRSVRASTRRRHTGAPRGTTTTRSSHTGAPRGTATRSSTRPLARRAGIGIA